MPLSQHTIALRSALAFTCGMVYIYIYVYVYVYIHIHMYIYIHMNPSYHLTDLAKGQERQIF